jgi:hypothetical protein
MKLIVSYLIRGMYLIKNREESLKKIFLLKLSLKSASANIYFFLIVIMY